MIEDRYLHIVIVIVVARAVLVMAHWIVRAVTWRLASPAYRESVERLRRREVLPALVVEDEPESESVILWVGGGRCDESLRRGPRLHVLPCDNGSVGIIICRPQDGVPAELYTGEVRELLGSRWYGLIQMLEETLGHPSDRLSRSGG